MTQSKHLPYRVPAFSVGNTGKLFISPCTCVLIRNKLPSLQTSVPSTLTETTIPGLPLSSCKNKSQTFYPGLSKKSSRITLYVINGLWCLSLPLTDCPQCSPKKTFKALIFASNNVEKVNKPTITCMGTFCDTIGPRIAILWRFCMLKLYKMWISSTSWLHVS